MRLQSILAVPAVYRTFIAFVAGDARRRYVEQYVRPAPDDRILDLGCGPGDILDALPAGVHYTGVDLSREYIEAAVRRFNGRGTFACRSVLEYEVLAPGSYDRVLANGLVHHLDDEGVRRLFQIARTALKPDGWMVTLDGCFVPGQSAMARWLLKMDRGQFVRDRAAYEELARTAFTSVTADVRHDLLRIPYTHLILRCQA